MKRKLLFAIVALMCSMGTWAGDITSNLPAIGANWDFSYTNVSGSDDTHQGVNITAAEPKGQCADMGTYKFAEVYNGRATGTEFEIYKELSVTNGTYIFQMAAFGRFANMAEDGTTDINGEIFANGATAAVTSGEFVYYTVTTTVTNGTLKVGLRAKSGNRPNWWGYTDYTLVKVDGESDVDLTKLLVNSSFECNSTIGWKLERLSSDTGVKTSTGDYTTAGIDGTYLFNTWWQGVPITQTIANMPNGVYSLTVSLASSDKNADGKLYLLAQDGHSEVITITQGTKGTFNDKSYAFDVSNNSVTVGVVGGNDDGSYNSDGHWWYKADNFRLKFTPRVNLSPESFTSGGSVSANTWYAFTVPSNGWYTITPSAAGTFSYTQDGTQTVDASFSRFYATTTGKYQYLTAGTFYFKTNTAATVTIAATSISPHDDVTGYINDPSFEHVTLNSSNPITSTDLLDWVRTSGADEAFISYKINDRIFDEVDGNNLYNTWGGSPANGFYLNQTLHNLPIGMYQLQCYVASNGDATVRVALGSAYDDIACGTDKTKGHLATVEFYNSSVSDVLINVTSSSWFKADNFKLTYYGITVNEIATAVDFSSATSATSGTWYKFTTGSSSDAYILSSSGDATIKYTTDGSITDLTSISDTWTLTAKQNILLAPSTTYYIKSNATVNLTKTESSVYSSYVSGWTKVTSISDLQDSPEDYFFAIFSANNTGLMLGASSSYTESERLNYKTAGNPLTSVNYLFEIENYDGGFVLKSSSIDKYFKNTSSTPWSYNATESTTSPDCKITATLANGVYTLRAANGGSNNYIGLWNHESNQPGYVDGQHLAGNKSDANKGSFLIYRIAKHNIDFSSRLSNSKGDWVGVGRQKDEEEHSEGVETYDGNEVQFGTGNVLTQTISNLPNGNYEIKFYAFENFAQWGSLEGTVGDGLAQVFANNTVKNIHTINNKGNDEWVSKNLHTLHVFVTDGSLIYGVKNIAEGGNWAACKAVSLTYLDEEVTADLDLTGLILNPSFEDIGAVGATSPHNENAGWIGNGRTLHEKEDWTGTNRIVTTQNGNGYNRKQSITFPYAGTYRLDIYGLTVTNGEFGAKIADEAGSDILASSIQTYNRSLKHYTVGTDGNETSTLNSSGNNWTIEHLYFDIPNNNTTKYIHLHSNYSEPNPLAYIGALKLTYVGQLSALPLSENTSYSSEAGRYNVNLTRSFNTAAWNTLVLPFDMTPAEAESLFGEGITIANYTGTEEVSTGIYRLLFTTENASIKANEPVLIWGATDVNGGTISNREVETGLPILIPQDATYSFVGSYGASTQLATGDYFIGSDNKLYSVGSDLPSMKGTRGFFRPVSGSSDVKAMSFEIDGDATGIMMLDEEVTQIISGDIYNLAGQRVNKMQKGIYIVNGKKVLIK